MSGNGREIQGSAQSQPLSDAGPNSPRSLDATRSDGLGDPDAPANYLRRLQSRLRNAYDTHPQKRAMVFGEDMELLERALTALEALTEIAGFTRTRPGGDPGSYQRGYDIGFNNAGLVAAGIARAAIAKATGR